MRVIPAALTTLLTGSQSSYGMEDLYEFNSPILGYARVTSGSANTTYGGNTFSAGTVIVSRDQIRWRLGTETDQLSIDIGHGGTALFGSSSVTWSSAAIMGALDGATVKVWRAFYDNTGAFVEAALMFTGYVGPIEPRSSSVRLVVESLMAKLKVQFPRYELAAGCPFNLYDSGTCNLTRPTTWDSRTTASGSSVTAVKIASFNIATDTFVNGYLVFLSGALANQARTITADSNDGSNHTVAVAPALPSAPASGVTVKLVMGCDKTAATCETKFGNLSHFGGVPYYVKL